MPKDPPPKHGEKAKKQRHLSIDKTRHEDDDDLKSQSDTAYPQWSPTTRSKHPADINKRPKWQQRERSDERQDLTRDEMRPGRQEGQIFPQFGEDLTSPHSESTFNLSALSKVPLYEQCLRLRKHGVSVRLGVEAVEAMAQRVATGQLPIRSNNTFALESDPMDIRNPPPQEMHLMNQAIAFVLSLGADIDMPGFDIQPVIKCSACPEQFFTQTEKDEHCKGGRNRCQHCPAILPCKTLRDEHMQQCPAVPANKTLRDDHMRQPQNMPNRSSLELQIPYGNGGRPEGFWAEQTL